VVVSRDLRLANVYYSVLNRKKSDKKINIEINKLRKAFKKYMGPELHLKSTPDLKFYHDESLIYSDTINQLLHNLDIKKNNDDSESL
jgi:ribosome-binding factor A